MKISFAVIFFTSFLTMQIVEAQLKNSNLEDWPEGKSPLEIGNRLTNKFLNTPHSRYGNTHPDIPPTQITYPDVCTWLGALWFSKVSENQDLITVTLWTIVVTSDEQDQ